MNWKKFLKRNKCQLLLIALILPSLIITIITIATPTPVTSGTKVEYSYQPIFIEHYTKEFIIIIAFSFFLYFLFLKIKTTKTFLEPTKKKILILIILPTLWFIYHCESVKSICIAILPFNVISLTFSSFSSGLHVIYQFIGVWPPEMSTIPIFSFFIYFISSLLFWVYYTGRKNAYFKFLVLDFRKILLFFLLNDFFMLQSLKIIPDIPISMGSPLIFMIQGCYFGRECVDYFSVSKLLFDFIFWYVCSLAIVWIYDKVKKK